MIVEMALWTQPLAVGKVLSGARNCIHTVFSVISRSHHPLGEYPALQKLLLSYQLITVGFNLWLQCYHFFLEENRWYGQHNNSKA